MAGKTVSCMNLCRQSRGVTASSFFAPIFFFVLINLCRASLRTNSKKRDLVNSFYGFVFESIPTSMARSFWSCFIGYTRPY